MTMIELVKQMQQGCSILENAGLAGIFRSSGFAVDPTQYHKYYLCVPGEPRWTDRPLNEALVQELADLAYLQAKVTTVVVAPDEGKSLRVILYGLSDKGLECSLDAGDSPEGLLEI